MQGGVASAVFQDEAMQAQLWPRSPSTGGGGGGGGAMDASQQGALVMEKARRAPVPLGVHASAAGSVPMA